MRSSVSPAIRSSREWMSTQMLQPLIWLARSSTSDSVVSGSPVCPTAPLSFCSASSAPGTVSAGLSIRACMSVLRSDGVWKRFAGATNGDDTGDTRTGRRRGLSPSGRYVRRGDEEIPRRRTEMKYLLQIYPPAAREELERMPEDERQGGAGEDLDRFPEEERQAMVEEYLAIGRSREVIGGEQLQPIETATTVRVENGETLLTDGPFVDAKEHVGGFLLVQADDLDVALDIAARVRAARMGGAVELRPLIER